MKKLLLIGIISIALSGCARFEVIHNIDENGELHFVKVSDSPIMDEESPTTGDVPREICGKELEKWTEEISDKSCVSVFGENRVITNDKGESRSMPTIITTSSGVYQIGGDNFINKDGYILFNAREVNNMLKKMGVGENDPKNDAANEMAMMGITFEYKLNLPGEPVNYREEDKINMLQITSDKNFYFVSRLEEGVNNPFLDKMTEDNVQNIKDLGSFPELSQKKEEEIVNSMGNKLVDNAQKTGTPLFTNITEDKKEEIIEFDPPRRALERGWKDVQEDPEGTLEIENIETEAPEVIDNFVKTTQIIGQILPSSGAKTIVQKVIDSVLNFFGGLF